MGDNALHSKYSPSQAERILLCPGSTRQLDATPLRSEDEWTEEGTKAHTILEAGLMNGLRNFEDAVRATPLEGEQFKKDFKWSLNEALTYVWEVHDQMQAEHGDVIMWVETHVEVPVSAAPKDAGGQVDVALYSPSSGVLYIIDYKHGQGVAKDAQNNPQIYQYACGFLFGGKTPNAKDITVVIVQPRAVHDLGGIREHKVTPFVLMDYMLELDHGIRASQHPEAPLIPGVVQCQFCDAKSTCPALEGSAVAALVAGASLISEVKADNLTDVNNVDLKRLGDILSAVPLIKMWVADVDKHSKELANAGHKVPGFKLVEPNGRRQWYGEEQALASRLAKLIGCPSGDLFTSKFVNITDAEKLVTSAFRKRAGKGKKNKAAEDARKVFAYFTTKEPSKFLAFVPETDKRPAVNPINRAFAGVQGITPPPNQGDTT